MPNLNIAGHSFQLKVFTLADTASEKIRKQSAAIMDLFLKREAEFDVHESAVIDYPDISDTSEFGFLTDAATYAARRAASLAEDVPAIRIVVLTTYGDVVRSSFEAAGYDFIAIDMPAGPEHTAAFILEPSAPDWDGRTLYIEAVNEDDDKIKPSFVLRLSDPMGQLCGGACGVIHEIQGKRYAYLGTMALASGKPQGTGTAIVEQLVQFLRSQKVEVVHLGTQTAARFYEKIGFTVDHRLVKNLRVRRKDGQESLGDLVMLSMVL